MRARLLILALLLIGFLGIGGAICQAPAIVVIHSPTGDVTTSSFTIEFEVQGFFTGLPEAFLNFTPLVVTQTAAREFTASIESGVRGAALRGRRAGAGLVASGPKAEASRNRLLFDAS